MTLVIELPNGNLRHRLPDDPDAVRRLLAGLAPVIPADAVWSVATGRSLT